MDVRHKDECNKPDKELALHVVVAVYSETAKIQTVFQLHEPLLNNILGTINFNGFCGTVYMIADENKPAFVLKFFFNDFMSDFYRMASWLVFVLSDGKIFLKIARYTHAQKHLPIGNKSIYKQRKE